MRLLALAAALVLAFAVLPDAAPTARSSGCYAAGVHVFTLTTAALTLQVGDDVDTLNLDGPTTVLVVPIGDSDGDGRQELRTEILNFELVGQSPVFGVVKLTESPVLMSMGLIEENSPGTCFPATSYFDVFVQAELPGPAHNDEPARMQVQLNAIPPTTGTTYGGPPEAIPLYLGLSHPEDASVDDEPLGFITHASHTPGVPVLEECGDRTGGSQPIHTYGLLAPASRHGRTVSAEGPTGPLAATVWDACDPMEGLPGAFDGDYDAGDAGAFFGYGAWAQDPDCAYALNVHGGNVAVSDLVFGSGIAFVVGEDDQGGPVKIHNPLDGSWACTSSGLITPCPTNGDPCGPTDDADDCLTVVYVGTGATCGTGGGDGGYWVLLLRGPTEEDDGAGLYNPPITGTITAF